MFSADYQLNIISVFSADYQLNIISVFSADDQPNIISVFSADEQYEREQHREYVAVFSDGTVKWIPSSIYKSSCQVDMSQFPFDTQTCFFKFGSWTYDGLKLNLTFLNNNRSIDFGEFVPSSEWNIIDTDG